MNSKTYALCEEYMRRCMDDSAHDREHIYRVLYNALDIARHESEVDLDLLIISCLLHDIGRRAQYENPDICHAEAGAAMAYGFCLENNMGEGFSGRVRDCISAHRFRGDNPPQTLEAKILFDADKLDVAGAMGIARTLLYQGIVGEPLYNTDQGRPLDGRGEQLPSFLWEYNYKLKNIYGKFHTEYAAGLAARRRQAAEGFYQAMLAEIEEAYEKGMDALALVLDRD